MINTNLKYISLFESFNAGPLVKQYSNFAGGPVWHVSKSRIDELSQNQPMWFALEYDHSLNGWYENSLQETGSAYLYEAVISGKIAVQGDPVIDKLFNDNDLDLVDDYIVDVIVQNPTADEVNASEGTKLLKEAGYSGLIYYDYDPRDFDNDLEALIVFDQGSISDFSLKLTTADETR
jgi:hypothetical protein